MNSPSRNTIAMSVLGVVALAVVGYLIWNYLSPPPALPASSVSAGANVNSDLLNKSDFQDLREFIDLPVAAPSAGRRDPFEPLQVLNKNANSNSNLNAGPAVDVPFMPRPNDNTNANSNVNTGRQPRLPAVNVP